MKLLKRKNYGYTGHCISLGETEEAELQELISRGVPIMVIWRAGIKDIQSTFKRNSNGKLRT